MAHPILKSTHMLGQSIWLDFISRRLIDSGELTSLVADGVRGLTSNPTIFQQAIAGSSEYDRDILYGRERDWTEAQIFEHLAVQDITRAADALRTVYDESQASDGYVSLEVSPKLANDTAGTIEEAKRLWSKVNRPNLMIKVPGTSAGLPAIRALLAEGINVNVTLIFSLKQYKEVLATYVSAIDERVAKKLPVNRLSSVASFFVSRVDSTADKQLTDKGHAELCGKSAIANACWAYRHFETVCVTAQWQHLTAAGAQVQRPLWASTSTKNPAYPDTLYVKELVAAHTVNTMPQATLEAWKDHGTPESGLMRNLRESDAVFRALAAAGVDIDKITNDLIEDGVKKFSESFDLLLDAIRTKAKSAHTSGVKA